MRITILASLLLAFALVLSACAGDGNQDTSVNPSPTTGTSSMSDMPHDNQGMGMMDDQMFLAGMIEHHQGAIDMAEIALERAEHDDLRVLAEDIIAAQEAEIDQMENWHRDWFDGDPSHVHHGMTSHEMGMDMDMGALETAEPFDEAFIEAMIPHHEGAVHMAEQLLETTERPELRELAEAIISEQEAEIEQMHEWLRDWYGR